MYLQAYFLILESLKQDDEDTHKCLTSIFQFSAVFSMSSEFFVFCVFGNLPSTLVFLFTQLYMVFITLYLAVLNVSSFLQFCLILYPWQIIKLQILILDKLTKINHRWICEMSEEKILISAKIAILCHSFLINVYENVMVLKQI